MKGPQATSAAGLVGKLYEENAPRHPLVEAGRSYVKKANGRHEIIDRGRSSRRSSTASRFVDLSDPIEDPSRPASSALQIHSGRRGCPLQGPRL